MALVVALDVIMLPSFLDGYRMWSPNFAFNQTTLASQRATFARLMRYEPHAPNPWCNTVLWPLAAYDWRVTLVPAGFGVPNSIPGEALPPKSRYILLTGASDLDMTIDPKRLHFLGGVPGAVLYENPQTRCFARSSS